jgi:hypothetical protein
MEIIVIAAMCTLLLVGRTLYGFSIPSGDSFGGVVNLLWMVPVPFIWALAFLLLWLRS